MYISIIEHNAGKVITIDHEALIELLRHGKTEFDGYEIRVE